MKARPILFSGPMVRALLAGSKSQTRRVVKPQPFIDARGNVAREEKGKVWLYGQRPDGTPQWAYFREKNCPYGVPGDLLWVKENHYRTDDGDREQAVYAADPTAVAAHINEVGNIASRLGLGEAWLRPHIKLRPSIHMPRWASRLTLEITEVCVQRLQDISEADAIAEGLYRSTPDDEDREWFSAYHEEHTGEPPTQADLDQFNEGVWMAPGARQGWGKTRAERDRDQWGPTAQFAYRLLWDSINAEKAPWSANPWVWAVSFKVHQQNVDALLRERAA